MQLKQLEVLRKIIYNLKCYKSGLTPICFSQVQKYLQCIGQLPPFSTCLLTCAFRRLSRHHCIYCHDNVEATKCWQVDLTQQKPTRCKRRFYILCYFMFLNAEERSSNHFLVTMAVRKGPLIQTRVPTTTFLQSFTKPRRQNMYNKPTYFNLRN